MKLRILLLFLTLAAVGFSQSETAADPVFLTKAQKEELRKKEFERAKRATEAAELARIAEEARRAEEMKRQQAEREAREREEAKRREELAAIAAAKEKARQEVIANIKQAFANDLADRWAKQVRAIYCPTRTVPGGWVSIKTTSNISYAGFAARYGMTVEQGFAAQGMVHTTPIGDKTRRLTGSGEFWAWDKNCPPGQSLQDREEKRREQAAKYVTENPPEGVLSRPGAWKTYEVVRWDTLNKIAAQYRMALSELHQANPHTKAERITIGQKLWVWDDGAPLGEKTDEAAAAVAAQAPKVSVPQRLEIPGRWSPRLVETNQYAPRPWHVTDIVKNSDYTTRFMTLEEFQRANTHVPDDGSLPHGTPFWTWERDTRAAEDRKSEEGQNQREAAIDEKLKELWGTPQVQPADAPTEITSAPRPASAPAQPIAEVVEKDDMGRTIPKKLTRPGRGWRIYNVRPGDTQLKIAGKKNMSLVELAQGNPTVVWSRLRPGQEVWVWEE